MQIFSQISREIFQNYIRNGISVDDLQNDRLLIPFEHLNHATFQFFVNFSKNTPSLPLFSHCVEANLDFAPKFIERYSLSMELT